MDIKKVKKFAGKACFAGKVLGVEKFGGKVLGVEKKVKTDDVCRHVCASERECTCYKYNRVEKTCTTMKNCDMEHCEDSANNDMYFFEAAYNGYKDYAGHDW